MIQFLAFTTLIFGVCGTYNEGLADKANESGLSETAAQVWEAREPVVYSEMNN